MRDESKDEKKDEIDYRKLFNKKEPLDNLILELAKKGELEIGVVTIDDNKLQSDNYNVKSLKHRGRHTS